MQACSASHSELPAQSISFDSSKMFNLQYSVKSEPSRDDIATVNYCEVCVSLLSTVVRSMGSELTNKLPKE